MMSGLPLTSRGWRGRRTIRCGACRCGALTIPGSTRKSPPSPTRRPAPSPAQSPARCSCSALSKPPKAGCTSTSMAGPRRQNLAVPKAASARLHARSTNCWANAMDDPRLTPARPEVAAKYLEGKVKAARFVEGEVFEVSQGIAPVRRAPASDAEQLTQALKGERVTIYDRNGEGFAWGQLGSDGYVGWLPDGAL